MSAKILRVIAFLTLICFVTTSFGNHPLAQASIVAEKFQGQIPSVAQVSIPSELGSIELSKSNSLSKPSVFYIQDAHAILDAQKNIKSLIDYLRKQYGADLIALEGGDGKLDPTLIQTFPNEEIKKRVLDDYLSRAEITGPDLAAPVMLFP